MIEKLPIFVYGTLRKGDLNYKWILKGNTIREQEAELRGFDMYTHGPFPMIIPGKGVVKGDLITPPEDIYDVLMKRLDILEGYTEGSECNHYNRQKSEVKVKNGEIVDAWIYVYARPIHGKRYSLIEHGDWLEWKNPHRSCPDCGGDCIGWVVEGIRCGEGVV